VPKNEMTLMSLIFKNDARSLQGESFRGSFSKIVHTPVNGIPSLFRIDSVHQTETSLSHALLVNVKINNLSCGQYWSILPFDVNTTQEF
jgi:hypothetical protein